MDNKYKIYNNISGWLVWLFATVVYVMTIESSASFWDCGEFIAAGFKQQVGHPPGAPLWLMIARIFSLFAGDNLEQVAAMVNIFSALCSSFSILFLFWTITGLAKKMAVKNGGLTQGKILAILGSGAIGALAYTFSDSFWFSAVEAEVYAASSFTTALVFWLLIKWEANADNKFADRYLILVAYVMGLSIGVHILNLLALPALVYIYYFKRFKTSTKGLIYAGVLSVVLLGVIQYGIISLMVKFATKFEIFFTNTFGMPYDSGTWIYFLLIGTLITVGIRYTIKNKLPNLQNAIYGVLVILIGYSSFAMIVVRSGANPPMDENNPENIVNLLPYLNREQYGDRPLLYGQSFSSEQDFKTPYTDGNPVYFQSEKTGKYEIADEREGSVPNYDKKTCMFFPRMYSAQRHHITSYKSWTNFKGKTVKVNTIGADGRVTRKRIKVPTFGENLEFFFSYQVNFMYWRYFMWNFSGRQNDIQGHGIGVDKVLKGNWISGIDAIDDEHIGTQSTMPETLKNNPGRNAFFMLPFILGLLGMIYHFSKNWKDALVVMLLFFMTGLAIVVYLNQTPYQPRERDYAYAGSFYAFAIWIGLGVQAIFSLMSKPKQEDGSDEVLSSLDGLEVKLKRLGIYEMSIAVFVLAVFGLMLSFLSTEAKAEGHSMLYIAGVLALITGFSMAFRKISGGTLKAVVAIALCAYVPYVMGEQGWDDHNRADKYTARDFAKNYLSTCAPNAIIFTNGDNDTFPLWYVQDVEGFRTDVRVVNLSLLNTDWYIDQMVRKAYKSEKIPFSLTQDQYRQGTRDYILMNKLRGADWEGFQDIKKVMDYIKSDNPSTKRRVTSGAMIDCIPTDSLSVAVDKAKVLENGTVQAKFADQIPSELNWFLKDRGLYKAKMMILDLLANNDWERPIYFAITVGDDHYMNLEEYFQMEGLAYRLTPVKHAASPTGETGWIDTQLMYDNLINKYQWGNMEKPGVYMGEQVQRMSMNFRNNFARLAKTLILQDKDTAKAIVVLDKAMEIMPKEKFPYSFVSIYLADSYLIAGETDKGEAILNDILDKYHSEVVWYSDLDKRFRSRMMGEISKAQRAIQNIGMLAARNRLEETGIKAQGYLQDIAVIISNQQ